eukprot:TRINITY_DN11180_c0_g1_i1.p1 TRINITY_DN11180_c0_g1~~TRINITY_DN11180_c0_g1_i1.p1  ORF type:complete len:379 (-),score=59.06 TRINITY_DN11180_c0_g1_i1:320-1456(-)
MDFFLIIKFHLLILMAAFCMEVRADGGHSVFLLDNPNHRYIRSRSSSAIATETDSMLLSEVAAAITILLGFAPPASLPPDSSSKLNEVLVSNPFDRPRAVFMLEITGVADSLLPVDYPNSQIGSAFSSKVLLGSGPAEIELPGEDEVHVFSLDKHFSPECDASCTDKALDDLALWLGGSYVHTTKPLDGEFTVSMASGTSLNLHMSRKADREFAVSLVSLVRNIKSAMEMHEDFTRSPLDVAELVTGCFTGIKALQEQYGPGGVTQQGMELFLSMLTKLLDSLQDAYQGKIVGVILFNGKHSPELGSMLNVKVSTQASRWLVEVGPVDIAIAEVKLVRRSLALVTGIILLVSTLMGIYFLLNMPITRDTLLYSNVKLD